ncbi:MAG: CBS domain-containing protein, partial [Actinobacteria bacterium]|nr:CBS domain-containing protein [Actinomycetota bacterium]
MRFINEPSFDLTYDDVFMVPNRSALGSRLEVDLTPRDSVGNSIPLVVANMTAVAGRRMAETVARRGAIAVIPQDIPVEVVTEVIAWIKSRHPLFDTAVTLGPTQTVADASSLIHKRAHSGIVIVDGDSPVGVVTEDDLIGVDRFTQLRKVMSTSLVTLKEDADPKSAFETLQENRVKLAPVVSRDGTLLGVLSRMGALRAKLYRPSLDHQGRLRVAVAVGVNADVSK